ncbi:hypothetical protein [Catenulispora subtropica]|uniref:Uncharacterized protein n=1 Tax=Catenulispora subtropica TaxID=450798 RepID=A0ABP5CBW5_9ACTN
MPDRQRHGRLSDAFARLFAARSPKSPAAGQAGAAVPGDGHRAPGRPYEPVSHEPVFDEPGTHEPFFHDPRSGGRSPVAGPGEPIWPGDPRAGTAESRRQAWQLAAQQSHEPDRPDPMADTTQLSPLTMPRQTAEPAAPGYGPDTGLVDTTDAQASAHAAADAAAAAVDAPTRSGSVRSFLVQKRRRLAAGAAGVAAVGVLLTLPPVRAELRDSFTRTPQPYTALYFTTPPQVDGTVLTVPVSVHAVETGTDAYSVRVWTVDAKGNVDDSRSSVLTWDGQAISAVVSMPVNPAAEYVWVALNGSDQTLHYRIAVA